MQLPVVCHKDTLKKSLTACNIPIPGWEPLTRDRGALKQTMLSVLKNLIFEFVFSRPWKCVKFGQTHPWDLKMSLIFVQKYFLFLFLNFCRLYKTIYWWKHHLWQFSDRSGLSNRDISLAEHSFLLHFIRKTGKKWPVL